jgi:hypothetical protein
MKIGIRTEGIGGASFASRLADLRQRIVTTAISRMSRPGAAAASPTSLIPDANSSGRRIG